MDGKPLNVNDVVAFFVELMALAMLCAWGFHADGVARWVLGLGLPIVAIVLWGLFAAPRAVYRSAALALLVTVLVLGGGALASFGVLPVGWAVAFAVVVVVNIVLGRVGPFARPRESTAPGS